MEIASGARSRRRAVHQILGAGLDPREEAGHDAADAAPRAALGAGGGEPRPGGAAGPDDLLDRAVDRLLDLRVTHVADLAHRGRQVAGRHEEDVDVVDLEDVY